MPVLTFDNEAKRFILPSQEGKADAGYVEMTTYPLCADDYGVYYSKVYALAADPQNAVQPPVLNFEILARRIKSWNFTDAQGVPLPITADSIGHLKVADITFLVNRIEDEVVPEPVEAGELEKKDVTSLPTSSQLPTVNP